MDLSKVKLNQEKIGKAVRLTAEFEEGGQIYRHSIDCGEITAGKKALAEWAKNQMCNNALNCLNTNKNHSHYQ